jgi:NAD+ synthase
VTTPRTLPDLLAIDAASEAHRIAAAVHQQVTRTLKRRGAVVGLSGGIDSSVAAALCVRALGADRVLGILMPEADSAPESLELGRALGEHLGVRTTVEDVTPILQAAGCYTRRDVAIRTVVPEYGEGYKSKIVRAAALDDDRYPVFQVVVESPAGRQTRSRLTADAYFAIVAATNFKQRVRKMIEYHYADRHQYAVVGTPNRLEHDQGFFVKNGDGAADLKPIAHLYKTQVYELAEYLGIPDTIRRRQPTSDTYSLTQSQEEFYFSVPYQVLDVCLYGLNNGLPATDIAPHAGLTPPQVERIYRDIESKRRATAHLHAAALVIADTSPHHTTHA